MDAHRGSGEGHAHWMAILILILTLILILHGCALQVRWPRFVAAVELSRWLRREQRMRSEAFKPAFSAKELIR